MMRTRNYLIALAGISLVSGCKQQPPAPPEIDITPSEVPKNISLPVVDPPLDRQAILSAAAQAASSYALGRDDADAQKQLDGKRFSIRLRFGCGGPQGKSASGPRSWNFDEERRLLSFKIELDVEPERLPVVTESDASVEAVEGFWIERPWMLQAGCPRSPARTVALEASATSKPSSSPTKPAPAPPTDVTVALASRQVGVAQFFFDTEARTHRRANRAYETAKVLAPDAAPSKDGYDLLIVGRLRQLSDGRVITCRMDTQASSPSCIVSIQIDTVSIETPGGGETIATWTGAS